MKSADIKNDIKELQESIDSGGLPENLVDSMQKKLVDLEKKLVDVEAKEQEEELKQAEAAKKKKEDDDAEEEKKQKKKKVKADNAEKIEKIKPTVDECKAIIAEYKSKNRSEQKSREKSEKKSISSKVVDGIVRTVSGALSKELTPKKVEKIEVDFLLEAKDKLAEGIMFLSKALGGVKSDAAAKFMQSFQELIDSVNELKSKQ